MVLAGRGSWERGHTTSSPAPSRNAELPFERLEAGGIKHASLDLRLVGRQGIKVFWHAVSSFDT